MPSLDTKRDFVGSDAAPRVATPESLSVSHESGTRRPEQLLERLIDRLPSNLQASVRWLRRPSSRWVRIPAGVLLIGGGFLGMLPILGLWMLPLGLILLADDVPPLRAWRDRTLTWIERRRPHWLGDRMS